MQLPFIILIIFVQCVYSTMCTQLPGSLHKNKDQTTTVHMYLPLMLMGVAFKTSHSIYLHCSLQITYNLIFSSKAFLTVEQLLLLLALGVLLPGATWGIVNDGTVSFSPWGVWVFTSTGHCLFRVKTTALSQIEASSNFWDPVQTLTRLTVLL